MRTVATRLVGNLLAIAIAAAEAPAAAADVVRRCVGADGTVSWQSAPCGDGARETAVRTIDIAPTAAPVVDTPVVRPEPARRIVAVRRPATDAARERCAAARRDADARRDRDWNRMGFHERSRLDADVARACAR